MTEPAPYPSRRASAGLYPLWLGLIAAGGFTAWWVIAGGESTGQGTDPPADAAVVDAAPADAGVAEAEPSRLEWTVEGRGPMNPGTLDSCLARDGHPRALVVGGERTLVTHPDRIRPVVLTTTDDTVHLSTPIEADARLAVSLHVALTACLYVEGAAVVDPVLERRLTGRDWPQLGETGGIPMQHLVDVQAAEGGWRTRGLARLGRRELGIAIGEGDRVAAWRILSAFAAAAVVAPADARALERSGAHRAQVVEPAAARAAGWWTDADDTLAVLAAEGEPLKPVALPRPQPKRSPPAKRPAPPRPPVKATPKKAAPRAEPPKRAAPKPKPRPKPKKDVPFRPAYR